MPAVVVVVALGATMLGLLAVMGVALVRHLRRLTESVQQFRDEVQPLLDEIREGGDRAQGRLGRLGRPRGPQGPDAKMPG